MKKMETPAILGGECTLEKGIHYVWPRITKKTERILIEQLRKSISIYDDSGIFLEFKEKFANYHDTKYGILYNSGTSALYAMYRAAGIGSEDEIIVPGYTFFATATPSVYTGCKVVFCDCNSEGNIDPDQIIKKISIKTKAIVVTHMRGIPCDMDKIVSICKDHNIILLEDCSHAHGAKYNNKLVGTFGDMAIWSLQGQKIITGGEGGILLTNNRQFYIKALLSGHYNKICKNAIQENDTLHRYRLTGFGLKLRAHPLAIALANEQFDQIESILETKQMYYDKIKNRLNKYDFLKFPDTSSKKPSRYALILQFDCAKANNITLEYFVEALHKEGLVEIDIPKSTGLINHLDLFYDKEKLGLIRHGNKDQEQEKKIELVNAENYYNNILKLPVWGHKSDAKIVNLYIDGIEKICRNIKNKPEIFINSFKTGAK